MEELKVTIDKIIPKLQKAAEELRRTKELQSARMAIAEEFSEHLRKQGKDPYTISEKEVNKMLGVDTHAQARTEKVQI